MGDPSFRVLVTGVVSSPVFDVPGITEGSSNCPAGVRSSPPSGLKVNLLKKLV